MEDQGLYSLSIEKEIMAQPRVLVLRAPGTNCDVETDFAFEQAGAIADSVHVNRLRENASIIKDYQILCLPGGFSYGDDIAAGRILAEQLKHELGDVLREFHEAEKLILGICNGFQVLIKSGVLLPVNENGPTATLAWNDSGRFEDRWVHTKVDGDNCVFLKDMERIYLPMAHAEGKFVARDQTTFAALQNAGQLVLRYCSADGDAANGFPENPNGSMGDVAGCCDETGRVFGLMPHPERFLDATNHPSWTRLESLPDEGEGCAIFRNAVQYFA